MSSPAETSQQQPTPTPQHTGFDPIAFWYLHKTKIIALAVLFVVALVGYTVFEIAQRSARESANKAFADAKTVDDLKKVVAEHSGQMAAGNAQLKLADLLRKEGKIDEANTVLRAFIEKHPSHPMIVGAWLGLGQNAEAAGKTDEALSEYQKILTTYPNSYAAPIALLAQGRMQNAKGQNDAAKRSFEQVISQYPGTQFQMEAQRELRKVSKPAETAPVPVEPAGKPADVPTPKPTEAPADKPADASKPAEAPASKPAEVPTAKPEDKPANDSTAKPAGDAPAKPAEKSGN